MATRISIVAAIGKNRELGKEGKLLWYIPDDLKRFKRLTLGHPVIMGRKTFESIGKPLPGRENIVITHNLDWKHEGIVVAHSLQEAMEGAGDRELFVIGGSQIYKQAIPSVNRLYLTLIDDTKEADTFFPPYEHLFTKKISEESRESKGLHYRWVTLEK